MKIKFIALVGLLFLSSNVHSSSGVEISDLDPAEVLCRLHKHALSPAYGVLQVQIESITYEQASSLLEKTKSFDYLQGRAMKVTFSNGVILNANLYDRDNTSTVQSIVDKLRAEKASEGDDK